jgi:hypothetical protein
VRRAGKEVVDRTLKLSSFGSLSPAPSSRPALTSPPPLSPPPQGAGGFAADTLLFSLDLKGEGFKSALSASASAPSPRGWYGHCLTRTEGYVVVGGLAPDNSRLGDVWILEEEGVEGGRDGEL